MIISRKAGKAVMAAVAATRQYDVSYPFWSSWKDPVLGKGLETVVEVSLIVVDGEGATPMRWFAQDPLVALKAAVKRDPDAKLRIMAECDAGNLGGAQVHRDFSMKMLEQLGDVAGGVVSALAYTAVAEAYARHPSGNEFMQEAARQFGWGVESLREAIAMVDAMGRPENDGPPAIAEPDASEPLQLVAA